MPDKVPVETNGAEGPRPRGPVLRVRGTEQPLRLEILHPSHGFVAVPADELGVWDGNAIPRGALQMMVDLDQDWTGLQYRLLGQVFRLYFDPRKIVDVRGQELWPTD